MIIIMMIQYHLSGWFDFLLLSFSLFFFLVIIDIDLFVRFDSCLLVTSAVDPTQSRPDEGHEPRNVPARCGRPPGDDGTGRARRCWPPASAPGTGSRHRAAVPALSP